MSQAIFINVPAEITRLHNEICGAMHSSLDKAILIGELLVDQRTTLKHGEWLPFLKANCPFSDQTARNYIRIFENRKMLTSKFKTVLDLSDAYKLLATPKAQKSSDSTLADAGEVEVLEPEPPHIAILAETVPIPSAQAKDEKPDVSPASPPWKSSRWRDAEGFSIRFELWFARAVPRKWRHEAAKIVVAKLQSDLDGGDAA